TAGDGQPVGAGAPSPVIEQRPLGGVQNAGSAPNAPGLGNAPRAAPLAAPVGATNGNAGQGGLY
ncbi:MAG: hypothetical protein WBF58_00055, partial [Xanthobacteraceae bacterium]